MIESRDLCLGGMDNSDIRERNRRLVLSMIAVSPDCSSADVARTTGLSPQSVMRLVDQLETDALIVRGEQTSREAGRRGQPSTPLRLNPNGVYSVGCKLGWRHMQVVLCNMVGDIIGEVQQSYAYPDYRHLVSSASASIDTLVAKIPSKHRKRLIGVSVAQPTNIWQGLGGLDTPSEKVAEWKGNDLRADISSACGLPVVVYNDGNAACWGEFCFTEHPRPRNTAYLNIGTYIGSGLIVGSKLWEGPTGNSANLGSMSFRDDHGFMRTPHERASLYAFERLLKASNIAKPSGDPDDWDWTKLEPVTSAWIEQAAKMFSEVIANTSAVVEIDTAIIGGGIPKDIVDRIVEATALRISEFPQRTFQWPKVLAGRLGRSSTAIGAALRPVSETYFL